jgi:hypothetical protein
MTKKPTAFAYTQRFYAHLGWFYATFTAVDLAVDFIIYKCLGLTAEQTHRLVAGMEFGKKVALARSLLPDSEFKNVPQIKGYLTKITKESLRNVFTHSFIASDHQHVAFIHRTAHQGEYTCTGYKFEPDGFVQHTKEFVQLAEDFEKSLGFPHKEIADFSAAAIKEDKS